MINDEDIMDATLCFGLLLLIIIINCLSSTRRESYRNFTTSNDRMIEEGFYVIRNSQSKLHCSDSINGAICNRDFAGPHETFFIQSLGQHQYAIKSLKNDLWATDTSTGIQFTSPVISDYQVFLFKHIEDRKFIIQSDKTKKYCSDSGHGLYCDLDDTKHDDLDRYFEIIRVSNPHSY